MVFVLLFLTYLIVASLIAFFTVKIVGIPIGKKMFLKIVASILVFVPVYVFIAYLISKFVSRDLLRLEESVKKLPFTGDVPESGIREVQRLGEVLSLQSERIRSMVETQRLMLYRIAHDLRTPLTNLRNVLTAFRDGVIGEEERDLYIEKLLRETDKMGVLLEEALYNMKKVSRKTERSRVNLCAFLEELKAIWKLRLMERGVNLLVSCDGEVSVSVSPVDLEEILNNVIENSLKHTSSRSIEIGVVRKEDWVELTLRDDGNGFDSAKLMEAYRQGSLGLYIVRELTWRNGGEFRINTSGEGTEVVLRFPVG